MSDENITFNTKPLDAFLKAIKSKSMTAKIGILGQKDERREGGSNATIGAAHEFGTSRITQRSFLRMPISEFLPKEIKTANIFSENNLKVIMKNKSFEQTLEQVAIMAVAVVLKAFDTGGYGAWEALCPIYAQQRLNRHQGSQILVIPESHQLRDSISYRIDKS